MKNTPYVKEYNEVGEIINPIIGSYLSPFKNRQQRRLKQNRFIGNGTNFPLVVAGAFKYKKRIQIIPGTGKRIEHYDLIK